MRGKYRNFDIPDSVNKDILRRIWREHTKKHVPALIGVTLLTVLIAAIEGYSVSLLRPVFDDGFVGGNIGVLGFLCAQVIALYFAKGWFYYIQAIIMSKIGSRTIRDIQGQVFKHIVSLDISFFNRTPSGQMLSRLLRETNDIRNIAINFITSVFKDLITCLAMLSLMLYYSWRMFLFIFVFVPIGVFLMKKINKKAREIAKISAQQGAEFMGRASESLQNIRIIKSYCMEDYEASRMDTRLDDMFRITMKSVRNSASVTPVIESLSGLMLAGIVLFGGSQVATGAMSTGAFVTFLGAWVSVYKPLKSLLRFNVTLRTAIVSAERVYELIDAKPEVKDAKGAKQLGRIKGGVEFKNVSFAYEPELPVLSNISFKVPCGKTLALVGPSGGGKSTIAGLIPRFFDVTHGSVFVGGQDVRKVTQESLRHNIALVTQDVMLFDDTIAGNIAYGRPGANASMDDIIRAAKAANAHGFISAMKGGYDAMAGERGVKLSGGQKQRISIARAIIKDAPVLLLDEATSALDTESEHQVQAALDNLMKGRTTIVIAHRLSTIVNADHICVIDGGRIVEEGTHKSLLRKGGEYAKLCKIQFKDGKNP